MNFKEIKERVEKYKVVTEELKSLQGSVGWESNEKDVISVKIGKVRRQGEGYITDKMSEEGRFIEGSTDTIDKVNIKINKRLEDLVSEVKSIKEKELNRLKF